MITKDKRHLLKSLIQTIGDEDEVQGMYPPISHPTPPALTTKRTKDTKRGNGKKRTPFICFCFRVFRVFRG